MTFIFDGFDPANTTPVPDVFFDVLLPHLNEAQLKVMLYIIRRTLGFKKTADAISLRQFRYGITTKNKVTGEEKQLDSGCGLKNFTTISKALKSLEPMNCIERTTAKTDAGDDDTTVYRIKFSGTTANGVPATSCVVPSYAKRSRGTTPNGAGVLRQTESQETVIQDTDSQETVIQEGEVATSNEDRNAPTNISLFVEKQKRETNPHIPVPVLTVEPKEQTVSSRIGSDTPVQHSGTPPGLLPPPGAGAAQGDRPPMALSAKEIGAQEKKREKELWVIFEEELGTKYSANQRKLQKDGIALLIADDISDETLHAGLQALNTFERRTFTVFKFYGWLPNLGAKRRQFKAAANGDIAPHQEDEDYSDFDIYKGNGKEERAARLALYDIMEANGELIE